MVAIKAYIQKKHDDSFDKEQFIRLTEMSELHNLHPIMPTSIHNPFNLQLLFSTTSQLDCIQSTESRNLYFQTSI